MWAKSKRSNHSPAGYCTLTFRWRFLVFYKLLIEDGSFNLEERHHYFRVVPNVLNKSECIDSTRHILTLPMYDGRDSVLGIGWRFIHLSAYLVACSVSVIQSSKFNNRKYYFGCWKNGSSSKTKMKKVRVHLPHYHYHGIIGHIWIFRSSWRNYLQAKMKIDLIFRARNEESSRRKSRAIHRKEIE